MVRNLTTGLVTGVLELPTGYALVQRVDPAAAPARGAAAFALSAASGVKATISLDGLIEVQTALSSLPKPADWNQDPRLICESKSKAIDAGQAGVCPRPRPGRAAGPRRSHALRHRRGPRRPGPVARVHRRHGAGRDGVRGSLPAGARRQSRLAGGPRSGARRRLRPQSRDGQRRSTPSRAIAACSRRVRGRRWRAPRISRPASATCSRSSTGIPKTSRSSGC